MPSTSFPFRYAPDAFFMALPEDSRSLRLQAFETPWSITDEILCYWQDTLFGQLVQGGNGKFAKLLPKLDRQREYPWPSADAFASTIVSILHQFPKLEVWCEPDRDQHPVQRIVSVDELVGQMQLVFAYCRGDQEECPSFSYRPVRTNNSINWTR